MCVGGRSHDGSHRTPRPFSSRGGGVPMERDSGMRELQLRAFYAGPTEERGLPTPLTSFAAVRDPFSLSALVQRLTNGTREASSFLGP